MLYRNFIGALNPRTDPEAALDRPRRGRRSGNGRPHAWWFPGGSRRTERQSPHARLALAARTRSSRAWKRGSSRIASRNQSCWARNG
jgi:hypothetical protein